MAEGKGCLYGALTPAATFAGGDMLNLLNPEGADLLITRFLMDVTTEATGAATVDAGIAATGVSDDALVDGADIGAAPILIDSMDQAIAAAIPSAVVLWPHDHYLTAAARTVDVKANKTYVLGPWPPQIFNDATGYINFTVEADSAAAVALVRF